MRRLHIAAGASVGALALLASSLGASAAPDTAADDERSATVDRAAQPAGAGEFVVAYEGDAAAAATAVEAAGGRVVDVNEEIGIALVTSDAAGFADAVDAADAVTAVARNHSVGTATPDQPHQFVEERPSADERATHRTGAAAPTGRGAREPFAGLQWDMDQISAPAAHRTATGRGVTVGIIDTGVDASHPDIAPNFDAELSRNFTMDIPAIDGECEVATCIDPADVDQGGHGTHVAGTVAGARNGIGITGVAPDATIVNVRAGQDSGYFFLYETVAALTYAADAGLDVVNMSYYVDPWLYNCDSADDYVSGPVTEDELEEQAFTKRTVTAALTYAHEAGVTLVASAGNSATDISQPTRFDETSPDYPGGTEVDRTVTNDCLDLPAEGPNVITVGSTGPSTKKSDFSNYGAGSIDVAAPGGWFRDFFGTPEFSVPGNMVLAPYPLQPAIDEELVDENGVPLDDFTLVGCDRRGGNCGLYTYLQGTSMASPHVTGVAALVIEAHGRGNPARGYSLDPDTVRSIIESTATDTACPPGGVEDYTDEGRPPEWNATCVGDADDNGFYGEGIVNAAAAVR
jgi:subtilisin family serine protease